MNESKIKDSRMWEKWRNSGAVENMEPAQRRQLHPLPPQGLPIDAIGKHYAGPGKDNSTLSLGRKLTQQGAGWRSFEPVTAVVVPGFQYKLHQVIREYPIGTRTIAQVFSLRR